MNIALPPLSLPPLSLPARRCAAGFIALMALTLTGCSSIGVAIGTRMRLDRVPVTSLSASLTSPGGLQPGQAAQLVIVATTADGKRFTTVGAGQGKVLFDSFTFQSSVAQVNPEGEVSLPADARLSDGRLPHLRIQVIGHPEVTADLDIPVRYDGPFLARFWGERGTAGADGRDGHDGMDGSPGSADPARPSPGGSGSPGGNGQHGQDGGAGEPGSAVQVWLTHRPGPRPLLQALVTSGAQQGFYLLDPQGGTLTVETHGGAGGPGGTGGRGGRGGQGGEGSPRGSQGPDGMPGLGGRPGRDGEAGTIVVTVDPSARAYVDRLRLSTHSGSGRPGSAPEIRIAAVPALW